MPYTDEILRDIVHTKVPHACTPRRCTSDTRMQHDAISHIRVCNTTLYPIYAYALRHDTSLTRMYHLHTLPGTPRRYTSHMRRCGRRHKFSKVFYIVTFIKTHTRLLTFQNFCLHCANTCAELLSAGGGGGGGGLFVFNDTVEGPRAPGLHTPS